LALVGDFNAWSPKDAHWAFKNSFGVWELFLPDLPDGTSAIPHRWGSGGTAP
jgi:1,4-alpha-glucan branching enzyme